MSEYKYYFSNTNLIVPNETIGVSRIEEIKSSMKPTIIKSISENIHEISDNYDFYTEIPGKYHIIIYELSHAKQKFKIVKYKATHAFYYQFCIKSNTPDIKFNSYKVCPVQSSIYKYFDFDIQDFFDYNFEFFAIDENEYIVERISEKYANISIMTVEYENNINDQILLFKDNKIIKPETSDNINKIFSKDDFSTHKSIVCYDKKLKTIMIWRPANLMRINGIVEGNEIKITQSFKLLSLTSMGIKNSSNIPDNEIVEIYVESKKIKASPNSRTISTNELFRQTSHNIKAFGLSSIFGGEFDFMTKIHRNVIRNLYDKYLYINVLDIGIGKCRDVYSYSKYVNRHDIYGVEPNKEFSKYCTIHNLFNSTADDIFKQFKLKGMTKKFHTIVFCNSYNFVTNPYITMKECEEFLDQNGRIIMIYMNNDKVVDVKNKYYEIRKGESDEHLPKDSPLVNRQNFIQVFSEVTLVPPHHENQISESDILGALEKLNKDLEEKNAPKLELIEKGNMIHTQYSSWLVDEAKLFNSMFYYVVIGRPCKSPDLIIAFDPMTTTLQSYIDYLHKKRTFCNGIDILRFEDYEQQKFGEKTNEKTKTQCIAVKSIEQYEKLSKKPHELFINIQIKNELEYSLLYNIDIDFFIIERKKLLEKNPKHSKFGFPDSKSF